MEIIKIEIEIPVQIYETTSYPECEGDFEVSLLDSVDYEALIYVVINNQIQNIHIQHVCNHNACMVGED